MKRLIRWWRGWWYSPGVRHSDFIDLTQETILRKPTFGRPPWEAATAPQPAICLLPAHVPDPPALHPIVIAQLGYNSVAEYILDHFGQPAAA